MQKHAYDTVAYAAGNRAAHHEAHLTPENVVECAGPLMVAYLGTRGLSLSHDPTGSVRTTANSFADGFLDVAQGRWSEAKYAGSCSHPTRNGAS